MNYQLMYHSVAKADISSDEINAIREIAKANNKDKNITGCLLYHNAQFLQLLEGNKADVENLFKKISEDGRHSQITRLFEEETEVPLFKKSPMAFDVVDKDDFAVIGIEGEKNLDFVIQDIAAGKKLFVHISQLIEKPVERMKERTLGPSA